jgi:hypothetical protein
MSGPPGSGKTMLARRMPGILPQLTMEGGAHRGPQGPQRERGRQRGGRHAQAVPGAASYRIDLRVGRGWEQPAARGGVAGAPRCALPRRVARV